MKIMKSTKKKKKPKRKKIVRMELLSKEDKTKYKLYAVNITSNPNVAYDYEAYINYGQLFNIGYVRTND